MADFYVKSTAGAIVLSNRTWATGEKMVPTLSDATSNVAVARRWVWECTTGGTSTGTPTWSASVTQDSTTVTQNGVVWTARKPGYSSGSTADWAFSTIFLHYAAAAMSAGDRVFVSDTHDEDLGSTGATAAFPGTQAAPNHVLCVDDSATPPTAVATTGLVRCTSGDFASYVLTGHVYVYGIAFTVRYSFTFASNTKTWQHYVNCDFIQSSAAQSSARLVLCGDGRSTMQKITWENCRVKFARSDNGLSVDLTDFRWRGGSVISGGTTPTALISQMGANQAWGSNSYISGVDLSNFSAGVSLVNAAACSGGNVCEFRNIKLPTSWSGGVTTGTITGAGCVFKMHNGDATDTNYRLWEENLIGSVKSETTIVRTGGASDGTTSLSWKMATGADAEFPHQALASPEIVRWNDTTGSAITVTVEIVHDSQGSGTSSAFTDKEAWLEVQYLGTSGFPLSSFITDSAADALASAADQTSSSETWTTTGLTTPVKQKLAVTFTPQEKGHIHARVRMAGASDTCYVCPELTVS